MRRLLCVSLLFAFHFSLFNYSQAQTVEPCTGWIATVDEETQQIVLAWHPSVTPATMGYHICSGTPCLDYDTVFGRFDTTYICLDHSPLESHTYRLHVFDSSYNVSSLTPSFGNMVLEAAVPECATEVTASWSRYIGMPEGPAHYTLLARIEPIDNAYHVLYTTSDSTLLSYSFTLPEAATRARLKVQAVDNGGNCSFSNVVDVERRTADTAKAVGIVSAVVDSAITTVTLSLDVDTAYRQAPYILYRKMNRGTWQRHVELPVPAPAVYVDQVATPYDSLYCYLLGISDACGLNERFSDTLCVVLPDPPLPGIFFPNIVLAGDERNGTFRPVATGLKGDLYELDIYTRTGLLVFHSDDPAEGWTPGRNTPIGAYTYSLRCRYNSNAVDRYVGTVTVIR